MRPRRYFSLCAIGDDVRVAGAHLPEPVDEVVLPVPHRAEAEQQP